MSSARYELRNVGVYDRELELEIPPGGDGWGDYEAWLAGHNVPDPQSVVAIAPDFATVLAAKNAAVEEIAGDIRRRITSPSSPSEMASWTEKLRQARAYDGTDASAPMLALEGQARGTSTSDIVARVLQNADDFSKAEAQIAGTSGRHKDALKQIASLDELLAYDVGAGWPFVPPPPPATDPAG